MDHKSHLLERAEKSWMSFFIKKTKVAFLAAMGIAIWGLGSAILIPKESAPQIDYGIITVSTFYDGASAVDIDQLITQEIENEIKNVNDIRKIQSVSRNSSSSITLELEPDADVNKILNDVRSKVDEAKGKLPEDAEDPQIREINSGNERSLFSVHLAGDFHPALLRDYAEKLTNYLEQFSYIRSTSISGGAEREIFIDLDPLLLEQYKITPLEVRQAIRTTHKDSPIGDLEIGNLEYSLRVQGRHKNAEDIRDIIVKNRASGSQQASITVDDLAEVYEKEEDMESLEYYASNESMQRMSTVKITVNKSANTDIFKLDPTIRKQILDFVEKEFGDELQVQFTMEEIEDVRDSYDNVIRSGVSSIIIVIIIIMLFIGVREAFIAGSVIPLTFLSTIAVTNAYGGTLNFMINFSMILALGILVDTAIVIVEGIHEGIKKGFTPKESAMMALEEFKFPLISGMLTTLAVFIPLFTLPGILGKYLSFIPIAVAITLSASLLISLFLVPAIGSVAFSSNTQATTKYRKWFNKIHDKVTEKYKKFLFTKLKSRFWRLGVMYGVLILFIFSMFIPVKFQMFPGDDFDLFQVQVRMPEGTIQEETTNALRPVEEIIYSKVPEMKHMEMTVNDDTADMTVYLYKKDIREERAMRKSIEIANDLRPFFKEFTTYEVNIKEATMGPPVDSPVAIRIITDDANKLALAQEVAEDFKEILKNIPGSDNVKDDLANIPAEMSYRINREEALRRGVNPDDIATVLRSAVSGIKAVTLTRGGREVDVTLRYDPKFIKDFNDIHNIQILNDKGNYISVSQLVDEEIQSALNEIRRADRNIAITISSDLIKDGNALEVTKAFKESLENYELPDGISTEDVGENSENEDLFIALGFGFVIAIFLIFSILVVQFNSFSQPFIIVYTIVMSILGVNVGLYLTDTPRSLAFIIGIISLSGIVVNDAIIMVDRINNLRKKYTEKSLKEIIAFSGSTRLQPIILTTLTTAAGIFPLTFVDKFWAGLAITIMFGLVVASTLTLFVTPAMYYQFTREGFCTALPGLAIIGTFIFLSSLLSLAIPGIIIGLLFIAPVAWRRWKRKSWC